MKKYHNGRATAVSTIALFAAVAAVPVSAQTSVTSPEAGDELANGEIVVTALRREQRLQDVPAAISVIDATTLKAKGAQDLRDYLTSVPGVNFTEGNTGQMRVTIRGVSDGVGGTGPLTGIYIDEAPITESFFATLDPDVYDIDRVEVLRGPQGTLYGSSSMGGTVRVITKAPKLNSFEGSLEGTISDVEHGGWNRRVDGVFNAPIIEDTLALRVSAGYRKDDGWIDDVVRGKKDVNTVEKQNVRAQLLYKPASDTSITLGFIYQDENLGAPFADDVARPEYTTGRRYAPFGSSEAKLYSLTIRQDFGSSSLISATNYLDKDLVSAADSTPSLTPTVNFMLGVTLGGTEALGVKTANDFSLFTQEIRLASNGENRIDYVIGAFYSNAVTKTLQVFDFSQAPTALAQATGAQFFTYDQEYRTRQIAGFGELTFRATDRLAFTAGLRVFNVEQEDSALASGTLNGGTSTTGGKSSLTSTQQKYMVEFKATPNNLLYAQASQGYRNGGPTGTVPPAACASALAAIGLSSVPPSFGSDKLWNYEIGSKNTLLNRRMTLNASAFYIDWSNIQTSLSLSCGFGFVTNSGKARSRGFELETSVQPIDGLTLAGSLVYTDAELTQAAPGARAAKGDRLPLASRWSWNVNAQYQHEIGEGLNAFVRGEVNHVGDRWNAFQGSGGVLLDPYTTVNARIGIGNGTWSAAIFATNLFDERVVNNRSAGASAFELVGRPRTIGLNARVGF